MALKATICRAALQIADMERNYYRDHALTLARHPSETDERMMVRVLAYALHASDSLAFGAGIGNDDEPDLWDKDLTGAIRLWVDVGLPDDKRIRRACGRAEKVVVYCYGRGADLWWKQSAGSLARSANLAVARLAPATTQALGALASRNMQLSCTIQDGQVWLADGNETAQVEAEPLLGAAR